MVGLYRTNVLVLPFLFRVIAFSHQASLYKGDKSKDKSVNGSSELPKGLECVNAFPLHDFLCSPFDHVTFIHASLQETWARCYHRITQALLEAVKSEEPGRDRLLQTAIRWYAGAPQILLRRGEIGPRLQLFLSEEYDILIKNWAKDAEKQMARRRPSQPDTPQRRLNQCLSFLGKGHLRRGLRILEGLGRTPSEDADVQEQMAAKHPVGSGPFEPRETEDPPPDVSLMETLLAQTDPLAGVGTRGFRPGHFKCLTQGHFHHEEAKEAEKTWEDFGKALVGGRFPRWLTRSLNAGLITPLVKKPPAEGQTPDARPTNARDADVTLPLKAIQRKATPALRRLVGP